MIEAKNFDCINNVYYLTPKELSFSDVYISVRDKEHRFLSDKEVMKLPFCSLENPHYKEWVLRQKSTKRFINYLELKKEELNILDIGCGNGWFTSHIANTSSKNKVIGLDINVDELEQASRIFNQENVQFVYGDIYNLDPIFKNKINLIVLNASIQYFSNFPKLITLLKRFLKPNGEIHIIDSPFYNESDIEKAKQRTKDYYSKLGFPIMSLNYFHHKKTDIQDFKVMYRPKSFILSKVSKEDSPFMWLCYDKKINF